MEKGPVDAGPMFAGCDRLFLPYTGVLSTGSSV